VVGSAGLASGQFFTSHGTIPLCGSIATQTSIVYAGAAYCDRIAFRHYFYRCTINNVLWRVDPLLSNDREIGKYTTAGTK
jgi:hypothetical protein